MALSNGFFVEPAVCGFGMLPKDGIVDPPSGGGRFADPNGMDFTSAFEDPPNLGGAGSFLSSSFGSLGLIPWLLAELPGPKGDPGNFEVPVLEPVPPKEAGAEPSLLPLSPDAFPFEEDSVEESVLLEGENDDTGFPDEAFVALLGPPKPPNGLLAAAVLGADFGIFVELLVPNGDDIDPPLAPTPDELENPNGLPALGFWPKGDCCCCC